MSLWKGSAIERAAVNGNRFGTPLPSCSPNTALFMRRAERAQHDEDLVVVDELVGGLHGARHLVLVVLHDELDLAPVDAFLVGLLEAHARAFGGADAPAR